MKLKFLTTALALSLGLASVSANASPLLTLSSDSPFYNGSYSFAEIFTVGAQNIDVTALGAYDSHRNGFFTAGGIPVGIFRESDQSLLASTTVTNSDSLDGFYRFHSVSPITLLSGQTYRVVAVNGSDAYNGAYNAASFNPLITSNGYSYDFGSTLSSSSSAGTGTGYSFMANIQIAPSAVPVPAAAWLLGSGLLGLVGIARRHKAA